jgi:hypothetical protein
METSTLNINDLRRDATTLIAHKYLLDIRDLNHQDPIAEDEVRLIGDSLDGENWTGLFSTDDDAESVYEVSYREGNEGAYYITKYVMFSCERVDPSQVLY